MTLKGTAIWTDRISFEVTGTGAKLFLSYAAGKGARLSGIRCKEGGFTGQAAGTDLHHLQQAANQSGARFRILKRSGPGGWLERIASRPGLLVGILLFFLLQRFFDGFVWNIDFGSAEPARQSTIRAALAEQGIWEGCRIEEDGLRRAENALQLQLQETGWLSLNFTAGCLFVEENERQEQQILPQTPTQALYAKASGQILAIELDGGFAQTSAGQFVAEGQLLVNGQKADRDGEAVYQGASGTVWGRMRRVYTARQPLQEEHTVLTGTARVKDTWMVLGRSWERQEGAAPEGEVQQEWLPLQLGRIALPGCICRVTGWEKEIRTLSYSEETARAMAARACRLQLLQEFPDAKLENQTLQYEKQENSIICKAEYVFCADMAKPGPLAPLEG